MKTLFSNNISLKPQKAFSFLATTIMLVMLVGCRPDVPTVTTLRAEMIPGISQSEIIVDGRVISDGGGDIVSYGICLSRHPNPTVQDIRKESSGEGLKAIFTKTFSGLEANMTYYVRAYATNAGGTGYGEVMEVNTTMLPSVKTGPAVDVEDTKATLTATFDSNNNQTEVWFEVWREGETPQRVDIQKTGAQSAMDVTAHVNGLTRGEVYSYTFKAQTAGRVITGETKTFRLYYERVYDYDGNGYWTVKIGNQIWLAENLRTKHFLNGDPIPNVQPDAEWVGMKSPAWCYYNNDPKLGEVYGCLYNNYVGLDPRGLIEGYHTPSIQEYEILVGYLGGGTIAPRKLKSATDDWYDGRKGDNASGFNALPGGLREREAAFKSLAYGAIFQTVTPMEGVSAYYEVIISRLENSPVITAGASSQYFGRSTRLIKN